MRLSLRPIISIAPAYAFAAWTVNWPHLVMPGLETYLRWSAIFFPVVLLIAFGSKAKARVPLQLTVVGLAYLATVLISSATGGLSSYEAYNILRLAMAFGFLYYTAFVLSSEASLKLALNQLRISIFLVCVISLLFWVTGAGILPNGRLRGICSEPNLLGFVAMMTAAMACGPVRNQRERVLNLSMYAAALGTAYLTQGALAIVTVVALGTSVILFYMARAADVAWTTVMLWRTRGVLTVGFLALFAPLAVFVFSQETVRNAVFDDLATGERYLAWSTAANRFLANPWLGAGYSVQTELNLQNSLLYAHSAIIDHLGSVGLIGAGLFVAMVLLVTIYSASAVRRAVASRNYPAIRIADTCCLCLFALLAFSTVEAGLQIMPISWVLLWTVAGGAIVLLEPASKKQF